MNRKRMSRTWEEIKNDEKHRWNNFEKKENGVTEYGGKRVPNPCFVYHVATGFFRNKKENQKKRVVRERKTLKKEKNIFEESEDSTTSGHAKKDKKWKQNAGEKKRKQNWKAKWKRKKSWKSKNVEKQCEKPKWNEQEKQQEYWGKKKYIENAQTIFTPRREPFSIK